MSDELRIRSAEPEDAGLLADIYNHYVLNSVATFEEAPVSRLLMTARVNEVLASALPWIVAEKDGALVGYAYARRWKERSAYRFAVESTVYLAQHALGQGIGRLMYRELLTVLRRDGFHTVIGGIALPNDASVALHESLGFRKVAHFQEQGFKFDRWIDVAYWQLML